MRASAASRLGEPVRNEMAELADRARQEVARRASTAVIRDTPIRCHADARSDDRGRGMRADAQIGPLEEVTGGVIWVEEILATESTALVREPGSQPFALLPVRSLESTVNLRHLDLNPGTAWIDARQLAPDSPAGSWVGMRIGGGSLDATADLAVTAGMVRVPAGCVVAVQLQPVTLPGPPSAASGPGVDASRATCTLPDSATFTFAPAGATIPAFGAAVATLYGTTVTLQRKAATPFYLELVRHVVIPCTAQPGQFTAADSRSTLFDPRGAAPIEAAGWALPVTVTTPELLGQADGAGGLVLKLGAGVWAQWAGVSGPRALPDAAL